jgi:hypothetical protein
MGIQGLNFPSFTFGSAIPFDDDAAGVVLSYKFNDNVGLTALWARPWNDNFAGYNYTRPDGNVKTVNSNYLDNVDAFALVLPLTFDGVKVTPWGVYAAVGPNAFQSGGNTWNDGRWVGNNFGNIAGNARARVAEGMVPVGGSLHKDGTNASKKLHSYGNAWWLGLTGEVTAFDPFRIAWDVNYGSINYDDSRLHRAGWLAALLFEYKLDWAVPGLYGWYASGDDSNPANGSERMPVLDYNGNNQFSNFAFNGNPYIPNEREAVLSNTMTGTWGLGVRLKNMSFVEDLKHTLRLTYIGGTNSPTMAKYISGRKALQMADINPDGFYGPGANSGIAGAGPLYMTTGDSALEIGLNTTYQMYENFQIYLDANYLATWLDKSKSVWGHTLMNGRSDQVRDPWNVNLSFVYSF